MFVLRSLVELCESPGGREVIALIIFATGVAFEIADHHVIGSELIGIAVARLALLARKK